MPNDHTGHPRKKNQLGRKGSRILVVTALVLSIAIPVVSALLVTSMGTDEALQQRLDSIEAMRAPQPPPVPTIEPTPLQGPPLVPPDSVHAQ
jgi:hypothetical protein